MKIHLWGTDFRRSSAEMRKKLAIALPEREGKLREILGLGFKDILYLWTCNRVEFYTTADDYFCDTRHLWLAVLKHLGMSDEDYYRGYHLEGKSALRHLMRVAASLESLVVGESQILGQLKECLKWSHEVGIGVEKQLERAFHLAFEAAKRVRTETGIAEKPVSVASLGIQHLQTLEAEFPLSRAVVVGRSPISFLVIQWLKKNRPHSSILWVNRSVELLKQYPEAEGLELLSIRDFLSSPPTFSHLFTATASVEPLFKETFFESLEKTKRLIFDFAEPPDVERVSLSDTRLIHMEDLMVEARQNSAERATSVSEAEKIIEALMKEYCLEQKEKPLLRDFNAIEPEFFKELQLVMETIEKEFPLEVQGKVKRIAEKLVKRNLHCSREHLREILRRVTSSDAAPLPIF